MPLLFSKWDYARFSKSAALTICFLESSANAPHSRRAPLSVQITGANVHDKWLADDLIISIVVPCPSSDHVEQHICMDKGYDYPDVHQFVELERYIVHIKHRRRRGEPVVEDCPVPSETQYPARRWVVERTLGWLVKRRSLRVR